MSFLEKIGILFSSSLFIEGIMKDLIVFYENPQLVTEFNRGNISNELNIARNEILKQSFDKRIVDRFAKVCKLTDSDKNFFEIIRIIRDVIGHSRISVEENRMLYIPSTQRKRETVMSILKLDPRGELVMINESSLNFEGRIRIIEHLDYVFLPKLAEKIGLDYGRIR